MEYIIRPATALDMPQVLDLIVELAVFENEADAVEVTVNDLVAHGFGETKRFQCFVAELKGEIVAMALCYARYSTWKGPVVHLEDLIVKERYRGSGIGKALLAEVVNYGQQQGVKRISWEVLDWNRPAIAFYESKGAKVLRDWNVVHLNEQGIRDFK